VSADGLAPSELDAAVALLRAHGAADADLVSVRGLEALVAGATLGAGKRAWAFPGRRERACALLRGASADRLDAARPYRVVPPGKSPAARAMQAVGAALASGERALVFCGTGSTAYGAFAEALARAGATRAPVTFVVSWYAAPGPFEVAHPDGLAALARSVGVTAVQVDGNDAAAVHAAVAGAEGPTLVEARLNG
jgi:TPP-dependent pyruvate/acetoin dehydrogenase alpha subunit